MKRISVLALCWLALALPVSVWAQFNYSISGGAATITEYTGPGGNVVIPGTLGGFPVKNIGPNAFAVNPYVVGTAVQGVTFPNSVTNIGHDAFSNCQGLTNVTFGTGLFSIEHSAFFECLSLFSVTFPNSVTNLGYGIFEQCDGLMNVTLPAGLTTIPDGTFLWCYHLKGLTIPSTVVNIEEEAFLGCQGLTNIVFPSGVTNIGYEAFQFCSGLSNLTLPSSLQHLENAAFDSCSGLTSMVIPAATTNIGSALYFPFQIGAFGNCNSLTNISVEALNPAYADVDGVLFDKAVTTLLQFPPGRAGNYLVPVTVTDIPSYGFAFCLQLTGVTLPPQVTQVNDSTFIYDAALTNVVIPEGIKSIGFEAFEGTGLLRIVIPAGVTNIGERAFGNTSLSSATIPASITNLSSFALSACANLTNVYFLGNAPVIDSANQYPFGNLSGTVQYLPGTTGWETTLGEWPTMLAPFPLHPEIAAHSARIQSNQFAFNLNWVPDTYVVVEASINLTSWGPISTNALGFGTNSFVDATVTNYPGRFYRVCSF